MSDHDFINAQIRRQIVEATYNAPHWQPPVNICGHEKGHRVEVYGEQVFFGDFASANAAYYATRKAADWAVSELNRTLARKEA